jgi:hypothetical protein
MAMMAGYHRHRPADARQLPNAWRQLLPSRLLKPTRVATHMHPDHIGMAGWITQVQCAPADDARRIPDLPGAVADTGRHAPDEGVNSIDVPAGMPMPSRPTHRFGNYGKLSRAARELSAHPCDERIRTRA